MRGHVIPWLLVASLAAPVAPVAPAAAASTQESHERKTRRQARAAPERAFGREGDPRRVKRVIRVDMSDAMQFFPSQVRVKRGETVRFDVRNSGRLPHEMVLGTMDDLKKRARLMKADNPEVTKPEAHVARPAPGESARIVWQFTKPGEFYYACLVPGHFDAGMIGTIVVR